MVDRTTRTSSGSTAIVVSITPVASTVVPSSGSIVGNVYRVAIANQAGAAVTAGAGCQVTLALRDPGTTDLARIVLLANGTWQPLPTVGAERTGSAGRSGINSLGDFALVGTPRDVGLSPFAFITFAAIALALLAVGIDVVRSRRGGGRSMAPDRGRSVK